MRGPIVAVLLAAAGCSGPEASTRPPAEFYLDCGAGNDSADGRSLAAAWKTLARVNQTRFAPGDSILLRRGTRCTGMLAPQGSGAPGKPITAASYGEGRRPVIDGRGETAALRLWNQEGWHIRDLETTGGNPYGIMISGDRGTLRHFRITDVAVHGVRGGPRTKRSGGIVIRSSDPSMTFEDVVIDGARVWDVTQWGGIVIDGGYPPSRLEELYDQPVRRRWYRYFPPESPAARDVTVRNSVVHGVSGDGIVVFRAANVMIENNSVWNTGLLSGWALPGQAPNAIWVLACHGCTIRFNEGFLADTPAVDGGVYDIDWGSTNTTIEFNYGHDSMGYCLAVLAARNLTTVNSVVRYNLCVDNGRSPRLARRQGDLFITSWAGGSFDGIEVYNNTFVWNPPIDVPLTWARDINGEEPISVRGNRPFLFRNNLVWSSVSRLLDVRGPFQVDHNLYWYAGEGEPRFVHGGKEAIGFEAWQRVSGQDAHSVYGVPKFVWDAAPGVAALPYSPGDGSPAIDAAGAFSIGPRQDLVGTPVPQGAAPEIGAFEVRPAGANGNGQEKLPPISLTRLDGGQWRPADDRGRWVALAFLDLRARGAGSTAAQSRTQAVYLASLVAQYAAKGLVLRVVAAGPSASLAADELRVRAEEWGLAGALLLRDEASESPAAGFDTWPATILVRPDGRMARRYASLARAPELTLPLRASLGPPSGVSLAEGR